MLIGSLWFQKRNKRTYLMKFLILVTSTCLSSILAIEHDSLDSLFESEMGNMCVICCRLWNQKDNTVLDTS